MVAKDFQIIVFLKKFHILKNGALFLTYQQQPRKFHMENGRIGILTYPLSVLLW